MTLKKVPFFEKEPELDSSSTFSKLIMLSLKEKMLFERSVVKIAS